MFIISEDYIVIDGDGTILFGSGGGVVERSGSGGSK